jgi:hypothetical protein
MCGNLVYLDIPRLFCKHSIELYNKDCRIHNTNMLELAGLFSGIYGSQYIFFILKYNGILDYQNVTLISNICTHSTNISCKI